MSIHESLFLKKFNPCADRVEAIERHLLGALDDPSSTELLDHIEKCNRCRRYYGYMEAVDKGFRGLKDTSIGIGPISTKELPSTLQMEMAQAMKRNLSKWTFEMGRSIMYKQGMITPMFLDVADSYSFEKIMRLSAGITKSLCGLDHLTRDEKDLLTQTGHLLKSVQMNDDGIEQGAVHQIFDVCQELDVSNIYPYFYRDQLFAIVGDYNSAKKVTTEGLMKNPNPTCISLLLLNKGRYIQATGDYKKSIIEYNNSLNHFEPLLARLNLGMAYLYLKKYSESLGQFKRAISIVNTSYLSNKRSYFIKYCAKYFEHYYHYYQKIIDGCDECKQFFLYWKTIK